jgi:molecular chaperone IbpA
MTSSMFRDQLAQFDPFLRRSIGFDRLFNEIDKSLETPKSPNYPPCNIIKDGDNYKIEIAVSGFSRDELDIEVSDSILTVTGKKNFVDDSVEYIHKGIGTRSFEKKFTLAQDLVVHSADIVDGVLVIDMEMIVPEEKKPRSIPIGAIDSVEDLDPELLTE